jgi:hypothetical protein
VRFSSTLRFDALPLSLALLAVFRVVGESLLVKELLFTRRKHKLQTATHTQDISVSKRHNPLQARQIQRRAPGGQQTVCENWMRVGESIPLKLGNYVRYRTIEHNRFCQQMKKSSSIIKRWKTIKPLHASSKRCGQAEA